MKPLKRSTTAAQKRGRIRGLLNEYECRAFVQCGQALLPKFLDCSSQDWAREKQEK